MTAGGRKGKESGGRGVIECIVRGLICGMDRRCWISVHGSWRPAEWVGGQCDRNLRVEEWERCARYRESE